MSASTAGAGAPFARPHRQHCGEGVARLRKAMTAPNDWAIATRSVRTPQVKHAPVSNGLRGRRSATYPHTCSGAAGCVSVAAAARACRRATCKQQAGAHRVRDTLEDRSAEHRRRQLLRPDLRKEQDV